MPAQLVDIRNLVYIASRSRSEGIEYILLVSVTLMDIERVIAHTAKNDGGQFRLAPWINTIDGVRIVQANPHLNRRWQWVYLLEKVQ